MARYRPDDGSEQWMYNTVKQNRVQQRNGVNPLDRRVGPVVDQATKEAQIHDPYIKDLVARRAQRPHFKPVAGLDRGLNAEIPNVDMDAINRKQLELQRTSGINPLNDADIDTIFNRGRHQALPPQFPQQPQYMPQQQQQQIMLREGYPVFRPLQQTYGNMVVLARQIGVINQGLAQQPFIPRNVVNVYIVAPNQQTVNIHEIQKNPSLCTPLVEIQGTPMSNLGTLLVPREAVVMGGQQGRGIIRDGQYPQPGGRMILRG